MRTISSKLSHWLLITPLALMLYSQAQAETVARYGISMADIPLTSGQPDHGAGAYQFTGHTIYDPLVAWEANIGSRPGKLVPGRPNAVLCGT
jgi:peptide/nickel transport system substrate-binding protein